MKRFVFIVLLIFIYVYAYADELCLKTGIVLKGELAGIDKEWIYYRVNSHMYKIPVSDIDFLLPENINELHTMIVIKFPDNTIEKANLVKLTTTRLYYKRISDNTLISLDFSRFLEIKQLHSIDVDMPLIDLDYAIISDEVGNADIERFFYDLHRLQLNIDAGYNFNKEEYLSVSRSNVINIHNMDFYEKVWECVYPFLSPETKELVWNLLEQYLEIEKMVNYTFQNARVKERQEDVVQTNLLKIRKEFYRRTKKIIYYNELIFLN